MRQRICSLICALSTVTPFGCSDGNYAASESAIIGGLPASQYPESVLVDLYRGTYRYGGCSGALIAPRVVLTAGHCVTGVTSFVVTAPFAEGQTSNSAHAVTYDWQGGGGTLNPAQQDIGLVILRHPIVLKQYPEVARSEVRPGTRARNIGRVDNGVASSRELFVGPAIALSDASCVGFPFHYTSNQVSQVGDSGGPVMADGDAHVIVAVNSGSSRDLQVLARTDLVAGWIHEQIAAHAYARAKPIPFASTRLQRPHLAKEAPLDAP